MDGIVRIIGERIRCYRKKKNYTQKELAEATGLHFTYIGQVERGEKNLTIGSLKKITTELEIPLIQMFEGIPVKELEEGNIPLEVYQFFLSKNDKTQKRLYRLIKEIARSTEGKG